LAKTDSFLLYILHNYPAVSQKNKGFSEILLFLLAKVIRRLCPYTVALRNGVNHRPVSQDRLKNLFLYPLRQQGVFDIGKTVPFLSSTLLLL